jgi:hypothetical protein
MVIRGSAIVLGRAGAIALLPGIALAATLSSTSRVGPAGIGPIVFGMTAAQAASTGTRLIPYEYSSAPLNACHYTRPDSLGGVEFMVVGGMLVRADVTSREIATTDGFRIGDSAAKVERFYGSRATLETHKYVPNARWIVVTPNGANASKFRIRFEVKDSAISQIIAGRLPYVELVEKCL